MIQQHAPKQSRSPLLPALLLSLTLLLTLISFSLAEEVIEPRTGIAFEDKVQRSPLAKLGVRTKGPIKVYAVGEYGPKGKQHDLFVLKMNFNVNAEKMSNALMDALKPRCEKLGCEAGQAEAFKKYVMDALPNGAKPGTTLMFNTGGNKVILTVNNGKAAKGGVTGKAVAKAFAGIYTDSHAVCKMNPVEAPKKVSPPKKEKKSKKDSQEDETSGPQVINTGIVAAITLLFVLWVTTPNSSIRISQLCIYPVKSCAEQEIDTGKVTLTGFQGDRVAMIVDKDGKCATSRDKDKAKLFFMHASITDLTTDGGGGNGTSLHVTAGANYYPLDLDLATKKQITKIQVAHNEAPGSLPVLDYGTVPSAWFETATGIPGCRLVGIDKDKYKRQVMVNPGQGEAVPTTVDPAPVSLADEAPFLLVNEASLNDLNSRMEARGKMSVDMRRFRPNIVLQDIGTGYGAAAWEEDNWRKIKIGDHVEFFVWQRCGRCAMTTIDRDTLARSGEPLATLNTFRENEHGQRNFGVHLIPDPETLRNDDDGSAICNLIHVGDTLEVLEYHPERSPKSAKSGRNSANASTMAIAILFLQFFFVCSLTTQVVEGFSFSSQLPVRQRHSSACGMPSTYPWRSNIQRIARLRMVDDDVEEILDDDDDDDDNDDYIPEVDIANFKPPSKVISFGPNRGRSSPSQRKAMGTSGSGSTSVHVCTNCGCESVKWLGRCPTCREWNTLQEFAVQREQRKVAPRPIFSAGGGGAAIPRRQLPQPSSSWVDNNNSGGGFEFRSGGGDAMFTNSPVRITDVYKGGTEASRKQRIPIPDDDEMESVLGGGIMKGSLSLLGGTPGVGKSTLLLQTAASVASLTSSTKMASSGGLGPVWYVSGEETQEQIASRAQRLQLNEPELWLLSETHVDSLAEQVATLMEAHAMNQSQALYKTQPPSLILVDSIQTMICDAGGHSAAGGVTQMRECVALLLRMAKSTSIPIILVGHVTKSGDVAGPRTVEHMVDCVLYLDGIGSGAGDIINLRMLRASKNRFGSSEEVGVYEMTAGRLLPVSDPSSLLLSHRLNTDDSEGCAITVSVEGLRAMTVEIQTLCTAASPTSGSKRTVNGIAYNRLALLLGVISKRCGMFFGKQDVYVNVVGSVRLDKNRGEGGSSSDLAVAVALVSSLMSIAVRSDTAFVGEIGLLGEIRPVAAMDKRIQEARRMGFSRIITPITYTRKGPGKNNSKSGQPFITKEHGIERVQCSTLLAAINAGLVRELPKRRKRRITKAEGAAGFSPAPGSLADLDLDEAIMDDHEDDGESIFM